MPVGRTGPPRSSPPNAQRGRPQGGQRGHAWNSRVAGIQTVGQEGDQVAREGEEEFWFPDNELSMNIEGEQPTDSYVYDQANMIGAVSADGKMKMIRFQSTVEGIPVRVLLDCGTGETFLSAKFAYDKGLPIRKMQSLCQCRGAIKGEDGQTVVTTVSKYTSPLAFSIQGYHQRMKFTLADLDDDYNVYLGMKWLIKHELRVHWGKGEVEIPIPGAYGRLEMVEPVLAPIPMTLEVKPLVEAKVVAAIREETEKEVLEGETAEEKAEREKDETLHRGWLKVMSDPSLHLVARQVVGEYRDVFCDEIPKLPPRRSVKFAINLEPGHPPPARPPYRLSFGELDEMRRQLDDLLAKGFIRPSVSPFAAPAFFMAKKDRSLRMCIDYRTINKITIKDKYAMPRPEELLDRLHGAKIFSVWICGSFSISFAFDWVTNQRQRCAPSIATMSGW
uniref:Reverse transcriptase domain-containing protein n=1 Tax=Chromera velia CCMP2878 TaxID=1169474 RepID=A0A0G4HCE2_9ALVE|eukprot:Cvel_6305.t1-p1 / transcript=Cvel_6305.t1 / gene=Cvel_6305 / organism=Chromera_velia_CCMP2878 / gene_product=Transposon Ty3-G Gag-Pol polyprotein, putative / transcript_product=Transposon Ty3-G Gag-Pol polyprotein, putative / location=Cvel_scaffold306:26954-28399(-) / protein_length=446 / sequence_SO=supercontig / SO=protein_coding / is_pseudo=false